MSAKDRLWNRFPRFIWGEGSVGHEEQDDEYTETQHLTHTRYPRFVCEYTPLDDDDWYDDPIVEGAGAAVSILANGHRFFHFLFIDPADVGAVAEVCLTASLCREELDMANDDDDDDVEGEERNARHAADPFGFADEPPLTDFESLARESIVQNTARLTEAMCEVFPDGWKDDWTKTGDTVTHKHGMRGQAVAGAVVTSQGPGVYLNLTLKAQAHALLAPEVQEEALALRAAWQADALDQLVEDRLRDGESGMCTVCREAFNAAMEAVFHEGWTECWHIASDGYSAVHESGLEVRLNPEATPPIVLMDDGAPVANLNLAGSTWSLQERVYAQGISVLSEIHPRLLAMAMTPHHQHEAALAQGAVPDEMKRRAISQLVKLFEDGWRGRWRADAKAGTATHTSGIVASLTDDGVQMMHDSTVASASMARRAALMLQARAVIERISPEETIERVFHEGSKAIREMARLHEAETDIFSRYVNLITGSSADR